MLLVSTSFIFLRPLERRFAMNKMRASASGKVFQAFGVWMKPRLIVQAMLLGIVLLALAGFANSPADDDLKVDGGASKAAIERFWNVYHGNEYNAIPQVEAQLQRAIEHDPENSTLYALLGATHFWHYGEYTRDPNLNLGALQQDLPIAVNYFGKALELDYYGRHLIGYINDDHLPGYLGITTVHLGQQSRDPDLIAKGDQMLDFAAYQFPEFNNFNRWAAHNTDTKDSDSYKKALDSLWQALDACAGTTIDRSNPDLKPYLSPDSHGPQEGLLVGGYARTAQL
jgi:hypothetical protein